MYLFISKDNIQKYNGEVLKRFVGKKLVKTIANPTDDDLREFGYMKMVDGEMPEYDPEKQYLALEYQVVDNTIYSNYTAHELPGVGEAEE